MWIFATFVHFVYILFLFSLLFYFPFLSFSFIYWFLLFLDFNLLRYTFILEGGPVSSDFDFLFFSSLPELTSSLSLFFYILFTSFTIFSETHDCCNCFSEEEERKRNIKDK